MVVCIALLALQSCPCTPCAWCPGYVCRYLVRVGFGSTMLTTLLTLFSDLEKIVRAVNGFRLAECSQTHIKIEYEVQKGTERGSTELLCQCALPS